MLAHTVRRVRRDLRLRKTNCSLATTIPQRQIGRSSRSCGITRSDASERRYSCRTPPSAGMAKSRLNLHASCTVKCITVDAASTRKIYADTSPDGKGVINDVKTRQDFVTSSHVVFA
ncbi:hypothetical protein MRX96_053536 [Rhipicephalus microplus]